MKRRLIAIFSIVAVAAIISVGSLAYFSVEGRTTNTVTTGKVDLEIHEVDADGNSQADSSIEVMPGDVLDRILTVENTAEHPMYLRVKLTKTVSGEGLDVDAAMSMDIDTAHWTEQEGYYYYNTAVAAGERTEPLFTTVSMDGKAMDNSYLGKTFTLDVNAQAVQSENNGATVFDAAGWSAE